jgi:hypothetical protein
MPLCQRTLLVRTMDAFLHGLLQRVQLTILVVSGQWVQRLA